MKTLTGVLILVLVLAIYQSGQAEVFAILVLIVAIYHAGQADGMWWRRRLIRQLIRRLNRPRRTTSTPTTTTPMTTTPPTTPPVHGCLHEGTLYSFGETFNNGYDPKSNWCFGQYCSYDGTVLFWDDFKCKSTTTTTSTTSVPTTSPTDPP